VERSVERRAHQLRHAGIEDGELPPVGEPLDVNHARDEAASMADDSASRFEYDRQANAAQLGQHGAAYSRGVRIERPS
jgi:hypothetical protein